MRKINAENYKEVPGLDLGNGIGTTFDIVEQTLPGLISIFNHIIEAIGNGPRIKRIKNLEGFVRLQQQINTEVANRLAALENK